MVALQFAGPPGGLRRRRAWEPPCRARAAHRLTAPRETPRASATSICFQPFCSSSQARSRRASIHTLECPALSLFMWTIIPRDRSNVYLFIHSPVKPGPSRICAQATDRSPLTAAWWRRRADAGGALPGRARPAGACLSSKIVMVHYLNKIYY